MLRWRDRERVPHLLHQYRIHGQVRGLVGPHLGQEPGQASDPDMLRGPVHSDSTARFIVRSLDRKWLMADDVVEQPGTCSVAPLWPQTVQRAQWRSLSLEASAPQRMINGAIAKGALCWHSGSNRVQ